jgi:tetratricopeptide (TPR) repeat protein
LESLKEVIRQARDLDQYVQELNQEAEESKQDKPIVRKAIGQVYAEKKEYEKALAQLKLAVEFLPNDAETHQELIVCLDKLGNKSGAIEQLLNSLQLNPRKIDLYRDLGKRLGEIGRKNDVERAYTSIVEVLPHESEGHAMLAQIRQEQNRWKDAASHWERVASIRSLEPTGLLNLAAAQIHLKQWNKAGETIAKLMERTWPPRFGDVRDQIRKLDIRIKRNE